MTLATPQATLEIVRKFGLRLDKSLGQHFLVDNNILLKIVDAADLSKDDVVVEIGPGIGTLTQALAERAGQVISIELDRRLKPALEYTLSGITNTHVLYRDALSVDLQELPGSLPAPNKLVANLPYQISTPLLATYLDRFNQLTQYVFMVQKEVADRISAAPSTKEYGTFSVKAQFYCDIERIAIISKNVFMPPPEVSSAIVKMVRLSKPNADVIDTKLLFRIVKAAFGQRRKTIKNALLGSPELDLEISSIVTALEKSGIDPKRRGETLSIEEFAVLSNRFSCILFGS